MVRGSSAKGNCTSSNLVPASKISRGATVARPALIREIVVANLPVAVLNSRAIHFNLFELHNLLFDNCNRGDICGAIFVMLRKTKTFSYGKHRKSSPYIPQGRRGPR